MVAILSKIFGLTNLDLIEDAIQDTFLKAALKWRGGIPENPEAWLTQAAKNRTVDLLRQIQARTDRHHRGVMAGAKAIEVDEYVLDHEVQDSQLRMVFVACNPAFSREEQIAFALKAISGFSMKEIAAALLQKEETIKKRLVRARKKIKQQGITLDYPSEGEIQTRIAGVLQIIYLIFNEGFHSTKADALVNMELCGEALRLCKLILVKDAFRSGAVYALFSMLCLHAARLEAKISHNEVIDLKHQDRSAWHAPLIRLGQDAYHRSLDYDDWSVYHFEAAIALEHVSAATFAETNWGRIIDLYDGMYEMIPSDQILLAKAAVFLQCKQALEADHTLKRINPEKLGPRKYLYHASVAQYYELLGDSALARQEITQALEVCTNHLEKRYLEKRLESINA